MDVDARGGTWQRPARESTQRLLGLVHVQRVYRLDPRRHGGDRAGIVSFVPEPEPLGAGIAGGLALAVARRCASKQIGDDDRARNRRNGRSRAGGGDS